MSGAVADSFALMHEAVPWVRLPCRNSGFRPEGGGEDEAGACGVTSFPFYVRQLVVVGKERLRHRSRSGRRSRAPSIENKTSLSSRPL